MLICIVFKTNVKISPLYMHGGYLYTLHLDAVASEAVVVLVVRTSPSVEFCGSLQFVSLPSSK